MYRVSHLRPDGGEHAQRARNRTGPDRKRHTTWKTFIKSITGRQRDVASSLSIVAIVAQRTRGPLEMGALGFAARASNRRSD